MTKDLPKPKTARLKIFLSLVFVLITFGVWAYWPVEYGDIKQGASTTKVVGYNTGKWGRTDYHEYYNQIYGKNLKPDENAAVWILRMTGQELDQYDQLEEQYLKQVQKIFGIADEDLSGMRLEMFESYLKKQPEDVVYQKLGSEVCDDPQLGKWRGEGFEQWAEKRAGEVMGGPWLAKDYPYAKKWLDANDRSLDLFVKASYCKRMFWPYIKGDVGVGSTLIGVRLPYLARARRGAAAVEHRANHKHANRDIDGAISDALAIVRVGRLLRLRKEDNLITHLVGISSESMGYNLLQRIFRDKNFTASQGNKIVNELSQLEKPVDMIDVVSTGERYLGLDLIQALGVSDISLDQVLSLANSGNQSHFQDFEFDVNLTLELYNKNYDQFIQSIRKTPGFTPAVTMKGDVAHAKLKELAVLPQRFRGQKFERTLADYLFTFLMPATSTAMHSQNKIENRWNLIPVGIALEIYKRENGSYPAKLDQIIGQFNIQSIPQDLLNPGAKLKYKIMKDGSYRIWSPRSPISGSGFKYTMGQKGLNNQVMPDEESAGQEEEEQGQ